MSLIKINNNWDKKFLGIDLSIGNICNYKCWYCFPGANEGDKKWPDYEIFKRNTEYLLNYYKNNAGKEMFDIHFVGGEPTHWPKLLNYIEFLKNNFNCLISMTSNGSKKLEYWKSISPFFDRINLSCHHQYVDINKFIEICDYLYDQDVVVSVSAMMDPYEWNKCINIVDTLKKSKRSWSIRYCEIFGHNISYNAEQQRILNIYKARNPNIFWFWKNNKYYRNKVTVTDVNGSKKRFKDNEILLKKLNNFKGWECNIGVDWLHISTSGEISGTCGQILFNEFKNYNLRDNDFIEKFNPSIQPSICNQNCCNCMAETNLSKQKLKKDV